MSKESKNVKAAREAVARGANQTADTRTKEKRLFDIGNHYASHLAVTYDDQKLLWDEYKAVGSLLFGATERVALLEIENADLRSKNEEFRAVYESENRSTTLKVERIPGADDTVSAAPAYSTYAIGRNDFIVAESEKPEGWDG
jgi:hypothetical protein